MTMSMMMKLMHPVKPKALHHLKNPINWGGLFLKGPPLPPKKKPGWCEQKTPHQLQPFDKSDENLASWHEPWNPGWFCRDSYFMVYEIIPI